MQSFTPEFQTELEKGRTDPTVLLDVYEFYSPDYIPDPVLGFDPSDAIECFAGQEITWNGVAYRREVISRGDITLNVGEKTNSVSIEFSNISRYCGAWAQSQTIEGMLLCIRCIAPAVTNDSKAMFHGRCDKPGDITKRSFPLTARQDFGNLNQTAPPRKFVADDPDGRLPSDPLFEGFPFFAVSGSYSFPFVQPSSSTIGRLLQRRETVRKTEQWSSVTDTPYGSSVPEAFGRCQMEGVPLAAVDKGIYIGAMWVFCSGPIAAIDNIKTRQAGISDPICTFTPTPAAIHLGDPGGTGTNLGNTCQADLGGGLKYSHTAYVDGAVVPTEYFTNPSLSDPNVLNELPPVTALILGRVVPLPDGSGDYVLTGWTDNPVHIARFILTDPAFVNINSGFMEDEINYLTALHCDEPILDESESQLIPIGTPDIGQAGVSFTRYRSTGLIRTRSILYDLGDVSIIPELEDGPYLPIDPDGGPDDVLCPIGFHHDPDTGTCVADLPGVYNATQGLLRKRYTANFPITEDVRCVDLFHKILLPTFRGYLKVTGKGKLAICTEVPSSATRLRSATTVGATSIPVLDVTPWKSGPELLQGRIVINGGQINSEARTVTSADYSTSGNSITLTASDTGGVTATASGATLSGGSTTVQASGTVTIGGTPGAGDTVTITIDGIAVGYILSAIDTTATSAKMLTSHINAIKKLRQYIKAEWDGANVITIKCLHGALNVPAFLKAHTGPIADPTTAPTIAADAGALQAGTYLVAYADQTTLGLTALTLIASVILTANQKINVSSLPAFPAGVTGRQFFVSDAPNSARLRYLTTRADAVDFSINSLPLPGAASPPTHNTTAEEIIRVAMSLATNSQDVFPARKPSTAVILNDIYLPDPLNGHKYQATSITTGITGSGTPIWPTTPGGTVVDGGVTWTEIGSTVLQQAGLTRANIIKDTYKWPLGSTQSSVNVVEIPFRDAKNDFALTTLRIHDAVHQSQVKKKFPLKIDGSAIDNYNQAFRIGNAELSKNREGDWFNAGETGPAGLVLEEGDLICASDDSGGHINVVTRIEELRIKKDHTVAITKARKYSTAMFSDDVGSHVIPIASTLRYVETLDSIAEFIDTPAIRESDYGRSGFKVSVSRDLALDGDWRGFQVYADYGDGYVVVAQGDVAATIGESTDTLADVADITVLDETGDLTVVFDYVAGVAPFTTCTEADLLANPYRNLFLVDGEYIQAATITDNGNRSFTLSDILHGRFETDCVAHSASERVVYIDGAEVFVPTDPSRIGIEYDYKFVTTNQDVADATAVPFTWNGESLRPAAPTDLVAARDSSDDWYISAVGHPTEAERPETYTTRIRRVSDGVIMRDIPTPLGIKLAAVFDNITGSVTVSKNNMYGTSSVLSGSARTKQLLTSEGTEVNAVFSVPSAFSLSEGVGIRLGNTKWSISAYRLNDLTTRVSYIGWAGGSAVDVDIPTVDSVVYVRIVLVGTELRLTFAGSPLLPTAPPNVILRDVPDFPLPSSCYLYVSMKGVSVSVQNLTIGGLRHPATIYTIEQQEYDNSGSGLSTIDVEMWQNSPVIGITGRTVREVF